MVLKAKKRKSSNTITPSVPEMVKTNHPNQRVGGLAVMYRN
jgi:hypothetical protein